MPEKTTEKPAAPADLPLFYKRPMVLEAKRHAKLSVRRKPSFGFAAQTNAIPLTASEFAPAQRHYPIVFTDDEFATPVAIVGLKDGRNLMVDGDNQWRPDSYIPAYVRRYPFIFAEHSDAKDLTLCVDQQAEMVEESGDNPLFEGEQPSAAGRQALDFCIAYQREHQATREFTKALTAADLLAQKEARIKIELGEFALLAGFRVIDETKFAELPAKTITAWHKSGWLALAHAHFLSRASWDNLVRVAATRPNGA